MTDIKVFNNILKKIYSFSKQEKGEGARTTRELTLTMQLLRDNFEVFESCCSVVAFIETLSTIPVRKFNLDNSNEVIADEILDLTILDSNYNIRIEWVNHMFEITSEVLSRKRFERLMKLCSKIAENEGDEFANICYNFFRMEVMIRRPIITMVDFKNKLVGVLKSKTRKYEKEFIQLFKEIYIIADDYPRVGTSYKLGKVCTTCGYFLGEDKHVWCGEDKNSKEINYESSYIIKDSAYKDYTRPGLIERDVFDKLQSEGFLVKLYPGLESKGDLVVEIEEKNIYLDCKTTSNKIGLWNEITGDKYGGRIIVVPRLHYNEHKEYFAIKSFETGHKIKIYDLADLITYLKRVRGTDKHE